MPPLSGRSKLAIGLVAVAAAAVASVRGQAQTAPSTRTVTFSEDVAPIVFNHCTSCHRPGEPAPFTLLGYEDVRPRGRQIAVMMRARQMPPWKAEGGDYAFHGDRRLSDEQIATVEQWVTTGMTQGDPARMPAMPKFVEGWQLGTPDLVVRMPEPYEVPAAGRDVYRNFVLPLNLSEDVWVKGVDFRPSARSVVHHALFFLDASGEARKQDDADPMPGYNGGMGGGLRLGAGGRLSFGGRGGREGGAPESRDVDPSTADRALEARTAGAGTTLGGWAPGAQARVLPDDLAFLVPKGSDLVISTHFHPSGSAEREASTVGLYFAKQPPSKAFTAIQLPPVFGVFSGINIPAGEAHYTISDSFVTPIAVRAFGISGHAHYLARGMTMTATLPNGDTKTLISISDWDFGWQEQYQFASYVDLPAGTRLDATVTYDNSSANRRNPSSPPAPVHWGEQSTDEMGSVSLQVVAANRGELPRLQQAFGAHVREKATSSPIGRLLMGARQRGR